MRGCGPLGCGCGLFGLLIQVALLAVIVLFVGAMLGVLPDQLEGAGNSLRAMVFDTFDMSVPAPICKELPILEELFGRCG
jgi:hypothetical protein